MSTDVPFITSSVLAGAGASHAFFTRVGGVSEGVYATLNGGVGSRDLPDAVAENRRRMAAVLGVTPDHLLVPYQIHSADALPVEAPWEADARPRCDALVTATPGLGLAVTGADCGIVLFRDAEAGVIGAAHAGWKGAFTGILESTVSAMSKLGARPGRIRAALGPTIAQASYEVGPEFVARFTSVDPALGRFFVASARQDHAMFDLPAYIGHRLSGCGVGQFETLGLDTYADQERFYSYRRSVHLGEPDYGRLIAAIALHR